MRASGILGLHVGRADKQVASAAGLPQVYATVYGNA